MPVINSIALLMLVTGRNAGLFGQAGSLDTAEVRTAATAVRNVRPEQASLTLQFTADGRTPAEAGRRLAARADSVRRAMMALGIASDSIVTSSGWYWWPERIQIIPSQRQIPATPPGRGYQAAMDTVMMPDGGMHHRAILDTTFRTREILEVRVSDLSRLGRVIDTALALRITEISRPRFSVRDVRQVRIELLREATERAAGEAAAIATASGGRLGRTLYLGTESPEAGRYDLQAVVFSQSSSASGETQVTAPTIAVSVVVYGRWQLLPR
ncbi:MAG: SIMPL domain-containing protein [Gemmatimonadales bacterium]|nr:SIMPL domain-containing protein [Gemmatimonadales bacterium]